MLECKVVITRCTLTVHGWFIACVAMLQLSKSGGQLLSDHAASWYDKCF